MGDIQIRGPLGLTAFDSLRAEDEPWLDACFVPPQHFELMAGSRSVAVFGGTGSGKTALYRALLDRCHGPDGRPVRLVANWHPTPPEADVPADSTSVREQIGCVFDACAMALLHHWARYPEDFSTAARWVQDTLTWFVHCYGQGDLRVRLGPLLEESGPEGAALLEDLLETLPPQVFGPHVGPERVVAKLTEALARMGLGGVWVMADGLEAWTEAEPERLRDILTAFLSTLPLFERARFAYKLLFPSQLEPALLRAAAVARHRVDGYRLEWDTPALRQLVERRLAFAFGRDAFTLSDLCEASKELLDWLERAGGTSPREWLDQTRPIVAYYLTHRLTCPVDTEAWKTLRRQHPPRVYLDEASRQVIVGGRLVSLEELPSKAYDILAYLYQRSGQVISKSELYFRAYQGLERLPRSWDDKHYESPKVYEGLMDTNLWRLRQAIEPDPSDPVLLVTVRGHGVRLESRW
jgi:DNA-binding winged helix-turn-helix (wHTH) protein